MAKKIIDKESKEITIKCEDDTELKKFSYLYDNFEDFVISEIDDNIPFYRFSIFERFYIFDTKKERAKDIISTMAKNIENLRNTWSQTTELKPKINEIEDIEKGFMFTVIKSQNKKIKDKLDRLEIRRKGTASECAVFVYEKSKDKVGIIFSNYNHDNHKLLDLVSKYLIENLLFENLRPEKYRLVNVIDNLDKIIGIKFDPGYKIPSKIKKKLEERGNIRLISNSIKLESNEIKLLDLKSFEEFKVLMDDLKSKQKDVQILEGYLRGTRIKAESWGKGVYTVISTWSNKHDVETRGKFKYLIAFLKTFASSSKSASYKEVQKRLNN